jgi:hypothetical protein
MSQIKQQLSIPLEWEAAVAQIIRRLKAEGLQVIRSFDLKTARMAHAECTCPHHGTEQCDCQMVVLLVYEGTGQPITMVAHTKVAKDSVAQDFEGETHILIEYFPPPDSNRLLEAAILQTLEKEGYSTRPESNRTRVT